MLCNVQLIMFFDIYNVVKSSKFYKTDDEDQIEMHQNEATSIEREIQTDLHPIPYNKNEAYVWNLWDFRRKAIELVIVKISKTQ